MYDKKLDDIIWENEWHTVFVIYRQFDLGKKYKVYTRAKNSNYYEYKISFDSFTQAIEYAKKIYYKG